MASPLGSDQLVCHMVDRLPGGSNCRSVAILSDSDPNRLQIFWFPPAEHMMTEFLMLIRDSMNSGNVKLAMVWMHMISPVDGQEMLTISGQPFGAGELNRAAYEYWSECFGKNCRNSGDPISRALISRSHEFVDHGRGVVSWIYPFVERNTGRCVVLEFVTTGDISKFQEFAQHILSGHPYLYNQPGAGDKDSAAERRSQRNLAVKAKYSENSTIVRFPINGNIKIEELHTKLTEKLPLPAGRTFMMKYKDQKGQWITITCNEDFIWYVRNLAVSETMDQDILLLVSPANN